MTFYLLTGILHLMTGILYLDPARTNKDGLGAVQHRKRHYERFYALRIWIVLAG